MSWNTRRNQIVAAVDSTVQVFNMRDPGERHKFLYLNFYVAGERQFHSEDCFRSVTCNSLENKRAMHTGSEIVLSWSSMRLNLHWQPEFHNWSPVGD